MINRTPQEWADFLGMKIACFSIAKNEYAYFAINLQENPFTQAWTKHLDEIQKSTDAEDFYKTYMWDLTKGLAINKYNNIFVPMQSGDIKMIVSNDNGEFHTFTVGRLKSIKDAYKLPITVSSWDKTVYVPKWCSNPDED